MAEGDSEKVVSWCWCWEHIVIRCLLKRVMSQEERKAEKYLQPYSALFEFHPEARMLYFTLCTTALCSRGNLKQPSNTDSSYKTHSGKAHSPCKLLSNMDQSSSTPRPSHTFLEQTSTVLEEKKRTVTVLQLKDHLCHLIHTRKQQHYKFLILHIFAIWTHEHISDKIVIVPPLLWYPNV